MATNATIRDIVNTHAESFTPDIWTDASRSHNNYFVVSEFFKKRMETGPDAPTFTHNFKVDESDNTVATELYDTDSLNRINLSAKGTVDYSIQKTHYVYDERESGVDGSDPSQILKHLDMQAADMMDGFAKKNNEWFLTLPVAPNTTNAKPKGLLYWVVKSSSTASQDFGFNGSNPSGYSDVAGLDRTSASYAKLKNGTFVYGSLTNTDGLRKLADAINKSNFKAPYDNKGEASTERRYLLLSHYTPWMTYQDLLFGANDNIGSDMGKYRSDNTIKFRGIDWTWDSMFDDSTSPAYDSVEPIYGIDLNSWHAKKRGKWFMKNKTVELSSPHNLVVVWMDSIYNFACVNPRTNFVGHKATT